MQDTNKEEILEEVLENLEKEAQTDNEAAKENEASKQEFYNWWTIY